jgi:hypothetical protein
MYVLIFSYFVVPPLTNYTIAKLQDILPRAFLCRGRWLLVIVATVFPGKFDEIINCIA